MILLIEAFGLSRTKQTPELTRIKAALVLSGVEA